MECGILLRVVGAMIRILMFLALPFDIEDFQPEWYTSTIYYGRDTPSWSESLNIQERETYLFNFIKEKKNHL